MKRDAAGVVSLVICELLFLSSFSFWACVAVLFLSFAFVLVGRCGRLVA